jgi:hypothetical protein
MICSVGSWLLLMTGFQTPCIAIIRVSGLAQRSKNHTEEAVCVRQNYYNHSLSGVYTYSQFYPLKNPLNKGINNAILFF